MNHPIIVAERAFQIIGYVFKGRNQICYQYDRRNFKRFELCNINHTPGLKAEEPYSLQATLHYVFISENCCIFFQYKHAYIS